MKKVIAALFAVTVLAATTAGALTVSGSPAETDGRIAAWAR